MASLRLGDATIAYDDAGQGAPVLLLHGFPTSRRLWSEVTPALVAAGFRTIAPDLVGYGDSSCPPDAEPDMASQASWLLGLLDALALPRVALVAHDIGTAAAQLLLARAPQRLRAVVLMDGVYASEWAMDAVAPLAAVEDPARLHRLLVRQLRGSGAGARLDEARVREVLASYEGAQGGERLVRAARALRPAQVADILPVLRARRVPALVLWGDQDAYLGVDAVGRPLAELLGAPLSVLTAGHFLPLERPDLVASAVMGFLATIG